MNNLAKLTIIAGIVTPLLLAETINTQAQAQREPGSISTPNVTLNVQRKSGNCPQTVGLWWLLLPYEGGADHTVIADTRAFADTTKLGSSNKEFVEFVSPLRSNYASCVGQTTGQEYAFYKVEFKNKNAYFRVDLRKTNAPDKAITYKTVAASRPYVRWAIAD